MPNPLTPDIFFLFCNERNSYFPFGSLSEQQQQQQKSGISSSLFIEQNIANHYYHHYDHYSPGKKNKRFNFFFLVVPDLLDSAIHVAIILSIAVCW